MKRRWMLLVLVLMAFTSCQQGMRQNDTPTAPPDEATVDDLLVTESDARSLAEALLGSDDLKLSEANLRSGELPAYYIYRAEPVGFAIISASERAYPVLGYSKESALDPENLPDGLKYMLGVYEQSITQARKEEIPPSKEILAIRDRLKSLRADDPSGNVVVEPLLGDIHWDQMPYYNALAPDPANVPIGCVATATSQILRYWEYPEKSIGSNSYVSRAFGIISADINFSYNWANMPKTKLTEPNLDIARLCYAVAIAVNMEFDYAYKGGSGTLHSYVPDAMSRHFGYPKSIAHVRRYLYDDDAWIEMIKTELDHKRPVQYGGAGNGGGHSFVLDGYDDTDMFHVNWGWGGKSDGWFKIDALNPDILGTGGGDGGFNKNQDMIINFEPPQRVYGDKNEVVPDGDEPAPVYPSNDVEYRSIWIINPQEFYIRHTTLAGVQTNSTGSGHILYANKIIEATAGQELAYRVELMVNDDKVEPVVAIYIDFNDDGVFENSPEERLLKESTPSNDLREGVVTIPADAKKGVHRIRVAAVDGGWLNTKAKMMLNGELEDYFITIK